jgi:RNA polymerase subunit RPABC4/transcription elongation factor Spt4
MSEVNEDGFITTCPKCGSVDTEIICSGTPFENDKARTPNIWIKLQTIIACKNCKFVLEGKEASYQIVSIRQIENAEKGKGLPWEF